MLLQEDKLQLHNGHSSHYEPGSIEIALKEEIILFCFPPHTSHESQHLTAQFLEPSNVNSQNLATSINSQILVLEISF